MSIPVLIMGASGTGKSASMRNFNKDELFIVNVVNKPLPFKSSGFKMLKTDNYMQISDQIKKAAEAGIKAIVIDDAQYLMANEFMKTAKVAGFQKFTDLALNFHTLLMQTIKLPDDVVVYYMAHTELDSNGNEKMKTIGKLLDEKITIEGLFTIVLKTVVDDGKYYFSTQNNGHDTVKSPMGLFEDKLIENDLKMVDTAIRNYYEI